MRACSVVSHSLQPIACPRFLCPRNFPGKNIEVELPFPTLGDLPDPGIKPTSLEPPQLAGGFFTTATPWETICDLFIKKLKKDSQSQ